MAIRAAVALQKALSSSLPTARALKTLQLLHFGQGSPWMSSGSFRVLRPKNPLFAL